MYKYMKKIILSVYPLSNENFLSSKLFSLDENIVSDPDDAEIILFAEHHPGNDPLFLKVLSHPLYKKYKEKCYLYHDADVNITFLPTISPSVTVNNNPKYNFPIHYLEQISKNPYVSEGVGLSVPKKYLFSFIGTSRTHAVRREMIKFLKDNTRGYLEDTFEKNSWELNEEEKDSYFFRYVDISKKSKFILCPRGIGPSSYRLYESLKMGLVPVIISDEWREPTGINWSNFSIRIKEAEVSNLSNILTEREKDYEELSQRAFEAYNRYFHEKQQISEIERIIGKNKLSKWDLKMYKLEVLYMLIFKGHLRTLLRYLKRLLA